MGTNTQLRLPAHLFLADLDGDGTDELVQVGGNRLLVTRVNAEYTGVCHAWFTDPIRRVIAGRFTTTGRIPNSDQLLVELTSGKLMAFALSDDRQELWWWFTQSTFIERDEHVITGDFDGDGREELLLYEPATGRIRCFAPNEANGFRPLAGFAVGDLAPTQLRDKRLLAGQFSERAGRADLAVVDRALGRVTRFDSGRDSAGHTTFRRIFTSQRGVVNASDDVRVANIDGRAADGLLVRSPGAGIYRLLRLEDYQGGFLPSVVGVDTGQLPVVRGRSTIATARLKEAALRGGPREAARHDVLLFDLDSNRMIRTDARHDSGRGRDTYWFAFSGPIPARDEGWPRRTDNDRWAIIRCRLSGTAARGETGFYRRRFTRPGGGGMVDYFMDVSYGTLDISRSTVFPTDDRTSWYDCGYSTTTRPGGDVVDPFDGKTKEAREVLYGAAVRASKVDLSPYRLAVAVFNEPDTAIGGSPTWVTLDPNGIDPATAAQEMFHGYDLWHSLDASGNQYGDMWDVMSGLATHRFDGIDGATSGPDLNAPYKKRQGFMPANRIVTLQPAPRKRNHSVRLAALNRPEAAGHLMAEIPAGNSSYMVEFRQRSFWDRGIPKDTVLVHQYAAGYSLLQVGSNGAELQVGDTFTNDTLEVEVEEIHGSDHRNDVWASTALVRIRC